MFSNLCQYAKLFPFLYYKIHDVIMVIIFVFCVISLLLYPAFYVIEYNLRVLVY